MTINFSPEEKPTKKKAALRSANFSLFPATLPSGQNVHVQRFATGKETLAMKAKLAFSMLPAHPNIAKVLAYTDNAEGDMFIVTERLDLTLREWMEENRSHELNVSILVQLLSVLEFLHSKHVVLGLLSPDTIAISCNSADPAAVVTLKLWCMCYTTVMSETQDDKQIFASDIYSAGQAVHYLLQSNTVNNSNIFEMEGCPRNLADAQASLTRELAVLAHHMSAENPAERPTAAEIISKLDATKTK
ncbi:hypothetical protein B566_EDAN016531 [Ephemera danica]|nr:hypothetical protein B566_EDAN016531 [Ephemera danica]